MLLTFKANAFCRRRFYYRQAENTHSHALEIPLAPPLEPPSSYPALPAAAAAGSGTYVKRALLVLAKIHDCSCTIVVVGSVCLGELFIATITP